MNIQADRQIDSQINREIDREAYKQIDIKGQVYKQMQELTDIEADDISDSIFNISSR